MLRQRPTQIALDRSDALWHTENLDKRKTEKGSKKVTKAPKVSATQPGLVKGQTTVLPYHFPKPPSAAKLDSNEKSADDSLVSKDPVPRNPAYWEGVVASAVDNPVPDHDFERDDTESGSTQSDGGSTYVDIEDYERSNSASIATEQGSENQDNPELRSQLGDVVHPSSLKRYAFPFKYHRRSRKRSKGEGSLESPFQQGLDGASDPLPTQTGHWIQAIEPDYEYAMQYTGENARYRSESTVSSHGIGDTGANMYTPDHDRYLSGGFNEETTPRPISYPRSMEQLQRRSSGLPRSSLHISQSAISSSPEKPVITPAKNHVGEGSGLLSQPPRRRITYRPRTDTYSYEESEISDDSKLYYQSSPSANGFNESNAVIRPASLHSGPSEVYRSYSFQTQSSRQVSDGYSTTSSIHTPSPVRNTPARYLIPSGLPPPFSATRRTVSQNPVVPVSGTRNPFSTPAYSPSASISASSPLSLPQSSRNFTAPTNVTYPSGDLPIRTRNLSPYAAELMPGNSFTAWSIQANSSSPMAPRTPPRFMPVYNDNLPADSQPQTPYQLPRHGVPIQNGYYTAPPRVSSRVSSIQAAYRRPTPYLHTTARVGAREQVRTEIAPPAWPEAWRSPQEVVVNPVALAAEQVLNREVEGLVVAREQRSNPGQVGTGRRRDSAFWRSRRGEGFWEGQENVGGAEPSVVGGETNGGEGGIRAGGALEWLG